MVVALKFDFVCDLEFVNWSLSVLGGENVGKEKGVYDLWKAVRGFNL